MKIAPGERVKDDAAVNDVYSNRVVGMSFDGAVVTVTLASTRSVQERVGENIEGKPIAFVNNRLALPPTTVVELHRAFGEMIDVIAQRMRTNAETIVGTKPAAKASKPTAN